MRTAKDIMTREVITVTPETPVEELARIFWEHKISGAPVVDNEGKVVAVVTESDLIDQNKKIHIPTVAAILDAVLILENPHKLDEEIRKMAGRTVREIASSKMATVTENTPLDEIATIMARRRIHTLPVLSGDALVGVIGKRDLIKTLVRREKSGESQG